MTAQNRPIGPARRTLSEKEAAPLRRVFKQADAEARLLEREWDNLLKDHAGQWVAVNGKEFLFADTLEALIDAARARDWPLGAMVVDHLIDRRPAVLLQFRVTVAVRGFFSDTRLVFGNPSSVTAVPYLRVIVELPALGTVADVPFLVDTGADITVLNPQDGLRLLPASAWGNLTNPVQLGGAGAGLDHFPQAANISFRHDDGRLEQIASTVYIATPHQANMGLESLLGRDILGHFIMTFDQSGRILTLV